MREHKVRGLKLEVRVPELDTSMLIIPADHVKNGAERYVILNRTAKSVIEACRGEQKISCSRPKPATLSGRTW